MRTAIIQPNLYIYVHRPSKCKQYVKRKARARPTTIVTLTKKNRDVKCRHGECFHFMKIVLAAMMLSDFLLIISFPAPPVH